ncbi:MAG: hypothetical protein LBP54_05275 [Campylobacteraceae bacterium]|jgi:hypothetical protein|nr:hypothetical protein [Campylobacteraceae bacterium]
MKNLVKLLLSAFILAFLGGCSFGGDEESWGTENGGTICAFADNSACFPEFSGGSLNTIKYTIIREPVSENDKNTFLNAILTKGYSTSIGGGSNNYFRDSFWYGNAHILTAHAGIESTRIYMSIEWQGSNSGWSYPDTYNDIFAPLPSSAKLVLTSTTHNFNSDMTSQFNAYSNKLQNEHGFSPYTSATWRKEIGGVVYSWTRYTNDMAEWTINAAGAYY